MALVREARGEGHLADGKIPAAKQGRGSFDPTPQDVLVDGYAHGLAKQGFQVRRTQTGHVGESVKCESGIKVVFDVREELPELPTRHSPFDRTTSERTGAVTHQQMRCESGAEACATVARTRSMMKRVRSYTSMRWRANAAISRFYAWR
jgi:hypothetical protein